MKITKELHSMWKEWSKIPKQILQGTLLKTPIIGKWHYHYENKNGRIGLIRLNHSMSLGLTGHCWEACGALDFSRYRTKKLAEIAIYKTLKESM